MLLFLDVTQVVTYDARLKGTLPTFSVGTPSAYPSWFQSDQCPILFFALWPPAVVGPEPTHNVASPLRRCLTQSNNFPTLMKVVNYRAWQVDLPDLPSKKEEER